MPQTCKLTHLMFIFKEKVGGSSVIINQLEWEVGRL